MSFFVDPYLSSTTVQFDICDWPVNIGSEGTDYIPSHKISCCFFIHGISILQLVL